MIKKSSIYIHNVYIFIKDPIHESLYLYLCCRMMSVFNVTDVTDNACINIYPIGRDFVATSETDVVLSFDPETLETKDRVRGRFSVNGDYYEYHSGQT